MQFLEKLRKIQACNNWSKKKLFSIRRNYHTRKKFLENLLDTKIKKTKIFMNEPYYLGLSLLEISKIGTDDFWYDYLKSKYGEISKCYMDTDSFIVYKKKQKTFAQTWQNMLKQDLLVQIIN